MQLPKPAFDYDHIDHHYSTIRKADPRIGRYVRNALNGCETVLNIGTGTGSYEPGDKYVIA